jgi:AcrR family transcriptional regulator
METSAEISAEDREAPKAGRGSLTRERIVRTALEIVDRDGLDALSMRRLGAELGVDPMAVYYYLPNKEALLNAVVEAVVVEANSFEDDVSAPIEDRVLAGARRARDVFLAHVNALPLIFTRGPRTPETIRSAELAVGLLQEAGLSHEQAIDGMMALTATVRGIVAFAVADPTRLRPGDSAAVKEKYGSQEVRELHDKVLGRHDRLGAGFDFAIRALVRGLVASASDAPEV